MCMGGLVSPQAWAMVWTYRATFLHGLGNTVQLAAVGLVLALALGMCFGLLSTSGKKPLTALARVYVERSEERRVGKRSEERRRGDAARHSVGQVSAP